MKTLYIARKSLLEMLREPLLLGLLLIFPILLVGFYYVAFGRTDAGLATYLTVLVINEDRGASLSGGSRWQAGEDLVATLRRVEWEGDPVFDVQVMDDPRAAYTALQERKASLLLAVPPEFTEALLASSSQAGDASPAILSLTGDPGSDTYAFARSFLDGLVRGFANQAAARQQDTLTVAYEFLPGTGTMSDFDFGVGGIIVFGIAFIVISTATVAVREKVSGTLQRLRLTRASAGSLLLGMTLAQMAVAAVQIPITFGAAVAMGFHSRGSLLLAILIGLLLNLSAVGLGLIVACFSRNDGDAANLGSGVLVPLVFLSGALFPMPDAPVLTIAGRTVEAYDILPTTHATEAIRRVLVFGEGPAAIAYELVSMALLSLGLLAIGVALYHRLQMRRA
jgi:ABC-2 type transport system permease protein